MNKINEWIQRCEKDTSISCPTLSEIQQLNDKDLRKCLKGTKDRPGLKDTQMFQKLKVVGSQRVDLTNWCGQEGK